MIEFSVLGPMTVRAGGVDLEPPCGLPGRMLALLLTQWGQRPLPVDVIADQLWIGSPPRTVRKFIQVIIHRLRRLPGLHERIVWTDLGYLLQMHPGECDAILFEDLLSRASQLVQDGNPQAAEQALSRALRLWRGQAFSGTDDVSMVAAERARLEELRLTAFEDRTDIALELSLHHNLVAELSDAVAVHPFRERLRGQLMLVLYRSGRSVEALEEYRRARALLIDELGVEPGLPLQQLHKRMLDQDANLLGKNAVSVASSASRSFLPRNVPGFTGRQEEFDWLDEVAKEPFATAVISTIAGMGGIGKTALMIHWAHRRAGLFPDGHLHVNLSTFDGLAINSRQALNHLLSCLGVPTAELPLTIEDAAAQYRALVAGRRILLLIDNAQTADQVRPLLPGAASCLVVITSRADLGGLVAREGARHLTLRPMPYGDSMELLSRLVGGSRIAAEPAAAEQLTGICGGIPLAIRIASAHLTVNPALRIDDYVSGLLMSGPSAALTMQGDEQNGIEAVFGTSVASLPPLPAGVFRVLSCIPGAEVSRDCVAAAANISTDEADAALAILLANHLVEENRPGRYALHDLLRDYAQRLVEASGEPVIEPVDRVLKLYRNVAARAQTLVNAKFVHPIDADCPTAGLGIPMPNTREAAVTWFATEYTNMAAAIATAAAHGMVEHVRALVDPLFQHCYHQGEISMWTATFESVVADMRRHGDDEAIYPVLNTLGNAYSLAGHYEAAIDAHTKCVEAWTRTDRHIDAGRARTNLAGSLERTADYSGAMHHLELALQTFHSAEAASFEAYVLGMMALIHQRLGQLPEARDRLAQALTILRPTALRSDLARTLNTLADVCVELGLLDEASTHVSEAITYARESGDSYLETMATTTQASILRRLGRFEESLDLSQQAHGALHDMGIAGGTCENWLHIGLTYAEWGRTDEALSAYREAESMAAGLGEQHMQGRALWGIGRCHTDPSIAEENLRGALDIFEQLGVPDAAAVREDLTLRRTSVRIRPGRRVT